MVDYAVVEKIVTYITMASPIFAIGGRVVYGWLKNAYDDGQITKLEMKKLGFSFLKIGGLALFVSVPTGMTFSDSTTWTSLLDVVRNDVVEPIISYKKK